MIKNRMGSKPKSSLKFPDSDIYCGNERIKFYNRHPIYKSLMKLEFEQAMREYMKIMNSK
ncbi:MAG: hypothetical protein EAX89_06375 [Candidatus Lokiarchaeota archaeon]|nr:hypothetical protein [Candidatus Lokiarchaeota archaeon]